ncbi:hypothetical protein [Spongorhabdus nitratireducens]
MSDNCISKRSGVSACSNSRAASNTEHDFCVLRSQPHQNLFLIFSSWVTGVNSLDQELGSDFEKELIAKHGYSVINKTLTEFSELDNSSNNTDSSFDQFAVNNLEVIKSVLFIWLTGEFQYSTPSEDIRAKAFCRGGQWSVSGTSAPTLPDPDWDKIPDSQGQKQ